MTTTPLFGAVCVRAICWLRPHSSRAAAEGHGRFRHAEDDPFVTQPSPAQPSQPAHSVGAVLWAASKHSPCHRATKNGFWRLGRRYMVCRHTNAYCNSSPGQTNARLKRHIRPIKPCHNSTCGTDGSTVFSNSGDSFPFRQQGPQPLYPPHGGGDEFIRLIPICGNGVPQFLLSGAANRGLAGWKSRR